MKKALILVLVALFLMATGAYATVPVHPSGQVPPPVKHQGSVGRLDDECTIDFIGFTYGWYTGEMIWPGGENVYYMSGLMFSNTCTPGETLFAYCNDLDHLMNEDPYCVDINPRHINPDYPTQYPAMAYVMTWYPVTNGPEDMIMQLAIWKMSNDERTFSSTFGRPWYSIPALYSLNTVSNTDATVNDPANERDSLALGLVDGHPRNVYMCGDELTAHVGTTIVSGNTATVPITLTLTRGTFAQSVGNTSRSGVKITDFTDFGLLSTNEVLTDASGNASFTISAPFHAGHAAHIRICTKGIWPKSIVPCEGEPYQQLIVQKLTEGDLCEKCIDVEIPWDNWEPVELSSFTAVSNSQGIELAWQSASETNLNRWEIERSDAGGAYQSVARVNAANAASGHSYRYVDTDVQRNISYTYRLVDVDLNGVRTQHEMTVQTNWMADGVVPQAYELFANYPNPFNPSTRIRFALPQSGPVSLKVYNAVGAEVATLATGDLAVGEHTVAFDAANLPSGLYFYTLKAGSFVQTRKMVLMK